MSGGRDIVRRDRVTVDVLVGVLRGMDDQTFGVLLESCVQFGTAFLAGVLPSVAAVRADDKRREDNQ